VIRCVEARRGGQCLTELVERESATVIKYEFGVTATELVQWLRDDGKTRDKLAVVLVVRRTEEGLDRGDVCRLREFAHGGDLSRIRQHGTVGDNVTEKLELGVSEVILGELQVAMLGAVSTTLSTEDSVSHTPQSHHTTAMQDRTARACRSCVLCCKLS
jgi:hypothetical protein